MAWHRTLRAALLAGALASPALAEEPVPPKPEEVPAPAPGPTAVDPYAAVTKGEDVRVRAGPSVNYRVLERLPKGAWVVVVVGMVHREDAARLGHAVRDDDVGGQVHRWT